MRADRLLEILMLLQTHGKMTMADLAAELEVSRRTILRDVDALSFIGIPIYTEGGHGGGVMLDEHYRTNLLALQEEEIRTLFLDSNIKLLHEVGLGDAAERTLRKLTATVPARYRPSVDHIRQRILIDPSWWWQDSLPLPHWDMLQQAVYEDHPIEAMYEQHSGQVKSYLLEPYSLVAKSSIWYLIARRDGDFRTFRVSRFHQITLLDTVFEREPSFDLPAYWNHHLQSFTEAINEYTFTLRIHTDRLNFVRMLMPGRFHIMDAPDTSGWVTAHFQLETMALAKMLVFELGAQAIVIEPAELYQAVMDTARHFCQDAEGNR